MITGKILASLPSDYAYPVIFCLHRLRNVRSGFVSALAINSMIPVKEAFDKENDTFA